MHTGKIFIVFCTHPLSVSSSTEFFILVASTEDYKMLEKINKVSAAKYADLRNIVSNVNSSMQQLDEKCMWQLLFNDFV